SSQLPSQLLGSGQWGASARSPHGSPLRFSTDVLQARPSFMRQVRRPAPCVASGSEDLLPPHSGATALRDLSWVGVELCQNPLNLTLIPIQRIDFQYAGVVLDTLLPSAGRSERVSETVPGVPHVGMNLSTESACFDCVLQSFFGL